MHTSGSGRRGGRGGDDGIERGFPEVDRIDVVLAVFLALFAIRGFWRGFSRELFALIGLVGGVAAAIGNQSRVAEMLPPSVPDIGRPLVAFVAIFLAVYLGAKVAGAL